MVGKNHVLQFLTFSLFVVFLAACSIERPQSQVEHIPLVPLDQIMEASEAVGEVVSLRAPIHTQDDRYPYFGYSPSGEHFGRNEDEILFPTDVLVVLVNEEVKHVFLARSPHGSCFIRWNAGWPFSEIPKWDAGDYFDEPCYGSKWDLEGNYISGPSPRDMDELPFEIKDGMLWVGGEIIYGETHP
jgi:hypothetical protein